MKLSWRRSLRFRQIILCSRINLLAILLFFFLRFCWTKLFAQNFDPIRETGLYPNRQVILELESFPHCRPSQLGFNEINEVYKKKFIDKNRQSCFIVEDLGSDSWWHYVSHEIAEIISLLEEIGQKSQVFYRPLNQNITEATNLTDLFFDICRFDKKISKNQQNQSIVVLFWNIDRVQWFSLENQLNELLDSVRIRIVGFIDDLHFETETIRRTRQFFFEHVAHEIFSTYPYLFENYYPNISKSILTWLPHAASIKSIKPVNRSAENRIFVSGASTYDWYPCLTRIVELCRIHPSSAVCLKHPDYSVNMTADSEYTYGGEPYFKVMRQYKFGLATWQSAHHAIAKLFEIPANGLALVTTKHMSKILRRLYLKENKDFLTVKCNSFATLSDEVARLVEMDDEKIKLIRENGQKKIFDLHLTSHRAQLLHIRLLAQSFEEATTLDLEKNFWKTWAKDCTE